MSEVAFLTAQNLNVKLGGRAVLNDISLSLSSGHLVALVGPNGTGKTTLLRALAGLLPSDGAIFIGGEALSSLALRDRARRFAYLPQGHVFHWPMSVAAIVMLGRAPHADTFSSTTPDDRAAVARALAMTETEAFADRAVTTLSGGERARVALARALATQAPVLLADEPTAALDPRHQLTVMELLRQAARGGGAVLAIMHDLTLAARFADRVAVMDRGAIVADGDPSAAMSHDRLAAVFGIESATVEIDNKRVPIAGRAI